MSEEKYLDVGLGMRSDEAYGNLNAYLEKRNVFHVSKMTVTIILLFLTSIASILPGAAGNMKDPQLLFFIGFIIFPMLFAIGELTLIIAAAISVGGIALIAAKYNDALTLMMFLWLGLILIDILTIPQMYPKRYKLGPVSSGAIRSVSFTASMLFLTFTGATSFFAFMPKEIDVIRMVISIVLISVELGLLFTWYKKLTEMSQYFYYYYVSNVDKYYERKRYDWDK
jgi:hypothetical protein